MKQQLENVNWVRDATPWSQETAFMVRELARQDQIIRTLTKRLLEK